MPKRHALRIAAMQALFQLDTQGDGFADQLAAFFEREGIAGSDLEFARQLVDRSWENRPAIDELIASASRHWGLQRIAAVDRAILRLAVGELLNIDDVPPKVAMNEAIELSKEFGTAESPQFINGLLDAIWKKQSMSSPPEADA